MSDLNQMNELAEDKMTKKGSVSIERLFNGIVKENPTFVLMLGMCPTLAVTTSAINGLGMGLTTMVVLALSNVFISLLRHVIPDKVRIPAFIVIIASFVTMVQLLLQGFLPVLYDALGIYIPLIVVNCIILGRAEAYAYKNPVIPSLFDGIGMGLGFSVALTCIGAVRELLGAGEVFGIHVMPSNYVPVSIFIMAPGAFFVLAVLTAIQNKIKINGEKKGKDMSKIQSGCGSDCLNCSDSGCSKRIYDEKTVKTNETSKEKKKAKREIKEIEIVEIEDDDVKENGSKAVNDKAEEKAKEPLEEDGKKSSKEAKELLEEVKEENGKEDKEND